jgi:hypothetical protein
MFDGFSVMAMYSLKNNHHLKTNSRHPNKSRDLFEVVKIPACAGMTVIVDGRLFRHRCSTLCHKPIKLFLILGAA